MKQKTVNFSYSIYENFEELPPTAQQLVDAARKACDLAHAPYSQFRVGASVLLWNDTILQGANQENAAYPMCTCAEQVALYHSAMQFPDVKVNALAIHVNVNNAISHPPSPCGACRQVILEYEQKHQQDIQIYISSLAQEVYHFESIKSLLPFYFSGDDLDLDSR